MKSPCESDPEDFSPVWITIRPGRPIHVIGIHNVCLSDGLSYKDFLLYPPDGRGKPADEPIRIDLAYRYLQAMSDSHDPSRPVYRFLAELEEVLKALGIPYEPMQRKTADRKGRFTDCIRIL